jgi:hypothetical protein
MTTQPTPPRTTERPGAVKAFDAVQREKGSAAARRFYQMEYAIQRDRLSRASELSQIEAIALHYVAHFNIARDILEIVKFGRYAAPLDEGASACLRMMADQIRNNHAHDLGIELSWPTDNHGMAR